MTRLEFKPFEALSVHELYAIVELRERVFIVEQNCAYLDADGLDLRSHHGMCWEGPKLISYLRLTPPGTRFEEPSFGRMVTDPPFRGQGVARRLIDEALLQIQRLWGASDVHISAQAHLARYYASFGFAPEGETYLEDGIPHQGMIKRRV